MMSYVCDAVIAVCRDYMIVAILDPPSWISVFPQNFKKVVKLNKKYYRGI